MMCFYMLPNSIDLCVELFAHNIAIRRNIPTTIAKQKLLNSQKVYDFYQKNAEDFDELGLFFESKKIDYVEYFDIIFKKVNREIYQPLFLLIKENYSTYLESIEKTKMAWFNNEFFKSLRFFVDKCKQNNFKSGIDLRGKYTDEAIQLITDFIDEAIMLNVNEVKILHGKGNGILRKQLENI